MIKSPRRLNFRLIVSVVGLFLSSLTASSSWAQATFGAEFDFSSRGIMQAPKKFFAAYRICETGQDRNPIRRLRID
ncbi:MAG: hypothetical protein H7328_02410 [Bdellovibrio sp.]|nr:hypothetical protein [Bdellovibrio sp.]